MAGADAPLNVGAVYSSEDVRTDIEADSTLAIRRGLTLLPANSQPCGRRTARGALIHVNSADGATRFSAPLATDVEPRVLSRMLMETYGWPVKFFKDIPELLGTLRDAIIGLSV